MECPFCGGQMKQGQVFCEHCGKEIQFVPDFEPEIEESIRESLSGLLDQVDVKKGTSFAQEKAVEEKEEQKSEKKSRFSVYRKVWMTVGICFVIIVGSIIAKNHNSYEYQMKHAANAYELDSEEGYLNTIKYAKRAIEIAPNSSDAKMLLASAYLKTGKQTEAVEMLEEIAAVDNSYIEAYKSLIEIYEQQKKYSEINRVLKACTDLKVVEQFEEYVVKAPEFSEDAGEYDKALSIKMLAGSNCTIYYTLDGTVPNRDSEVYTVPIRLEDGEHELSAICVNNYGLTSEVTTKEYKIHISIPDEPEISVDSGTYSSPRMISSDLIEGYEMFYTTDGQTPTRDSTPYLVPIPMPLGYSRFQFIMYDENGVASEIATREYNLELDAATTAEESCLIVKQALIVKGDIIDMQGHMQGTEAVKDYVCDSAFTENDQIFYLIIEYQTEPLEKRSKTGNVYAVNAYTKELYRAFANSEGYYTVEAF